MVIPPDYTRFNSRAGQITQIVYDHYTDSNDPGATAVADIMPALGTHTPVTAEQRVKMFGPVPESLFRYAASLTISKMCCVCRSNHNRTLM